MIVKEINLHHLYRCRDFMTEIPPFKRAWEFLPEAASPFGLWQLEYPFQSDIEILTTIIQNLGDFIKPIFFNVNVLVGTTIEDAKLQDNLRINKPEGFSIDELKSIYLKSLNNVRNEKKNRKFTRCELDCKVYITYYKNGGLISEWYPLQQTLEDELRQYPDTSLYGLIDFTMDQKSMDVATYTDIWIPRNNDDQLAKINGNRLRNMLITIERITRGTIVQWSGNEYVETNNKRLSYIDKYGFIKPEDLQEPLK